MKIEDLREMPNGDDYTVHQAWMQFRDKAEALEQRLQLAKELLRQGIHISAFEGWHADCQAFIAKLDSEGL